jgi:2'-5' RNA ligase
MAFRLDRGGSAELDAQFQAAVAQALRADRLGDWSSDHAQEAKAYSGWNYLAIAAIARQAARAHCYVYAKGDAAASSRRKALKRAHRSMWKSFATDGSGDMVPEDHWLYRLMLRPNASQTGEQFRWEFVQQMHLHGCCIIFNRRARMGDRIAARYIVPMALTMPITPGHDKNAPNGGVRITPSMAGIGLWVHPLVESLRGATISAEDLSVVRYPHPVLRGDGKSPTDAAGWWIDSAAMIDISRWKQLKRGPRPHGVVTVEGDVTPEDLDEIEKRLNRKLGDEFYDQRVIAVGNGTTVPNDVSPAEMDYVSAFDQLGAATLAIHGVGRAMAGLTDHMTYGSNAAAQEQALSVVQSDMDFLASDFENLARSYGEELGVEIEVQPYEDKELIERQLQMDLSAGIRTGAEWRAMRGLPPFGDWRDKARVTSQGFVMDPDQPPAQPQDGAAPGGPGGAGAPPPPPGTDSQSPPPPEQRPPQDEPSQQEPPIPRSVTGLGFRRAAPVVAVDLYNVLVDPAEASTLGAWTKPVRKRVETVRKLKAAGCRIAIVSPLDDERTVASWLASAGVPYDAINAHPDAELSIRAADVYWTVVGEDDDGMGELLDLLPDGDVRSRLAAKPVQEYGAIMLEMPEPVTQRVVEEQAKLDPADLAGDGLEEWPHVTLLYGLIGCTPQEAIEAVRRVGTIDLLFGAVSCFPPRDGVAAMKIDVESAAIHRAHKLLANALPSLQEHPEFKPHLTLAYVGQDTESARKRYDCRLTGMAAHVTHAVVSIGGKKYRVPLRPNSTSKQVAEPGNTPATAVVMPSLARTLYEDYHAEQHLRPAGAFARCNEKQPRGKDGQLERRQVEGDGATESVAQAGGREVKPAG